VGGGGGGGDRMACFAHMNSSVSGVREMDDGGDLYGREENQLRGSAAASLVLGILS
jgi:hypothetical protein